MRNHLLSYNCTSIQINRFAKCDTCVRYDAEKARLAGKQDELESLKEVYREHMKEFK